MRKEHLKTVEKVWGEEIWLVNSAKYCGKLLILNEDAKSSYHYHHDKEETFYCIEGYALLVINGERHFLAPFARPKTIEPKDRHGFRGITQAIILEISTHHDDKDVVRLTESCVNCAT